MYLWTIFAIWLCRYKSIGGPGAGLWDSKSGASLILPGTCIVLKSKFSWSAHLVNLEFLSFARYNHVSAALSVRSPNRRILRYGRNLSVAQTIAKHTCSTAAYNFRVSLNFLLVYETKRLSLGLSPLLKRTAPTSNSLASVWRQNGLL